MTWRDRFERALRANLNEILDRVAEFEDSGGFRQIVDENAPGPGRYRKKTIRDYYANLEVPYGSDLETVRESYRRLMKRYHPDRHSRDPEMEALANDLSQELTRAYQAVESWLATGQY